MRSGLVEGFALPKSVAPTVRISNLLYPVPLSVSITLLTTPALETTIVALASEPAPPDNAIPVYEPAVQSPPPFTILDLPILLSLRVVAN